MDCLAHNFQDFRIPSIHFLSTSLDFISRILARARAGEYNDAVARAKSALESVEIPNTSTKKAKRPTYQAAQAALMDHLEKQGWAVSKGLAVPHATSPDKERRLWFKVQAIWFTAGGNVKDFKRARSLHDDVRDFSPDQYMVKAEKLMKYAENSPDWG